MAGSNRLYRLLRCGVDETARQPAFRQIEQETSRRFVRFFIWTRLFVAPVFMALMAWIALSDTSYWRLVVLTPVFLALPTVLILDAIRFLRNPATTLFAIRRNVVGAALTFTLLIFCTGGIESPILPIYLVFASFATVVVAPKVGRGLVMAVQLPALWVMTIVFVFDLAPDLLPPVLRGEGRGRPNDAMLWTTVGIYTYALSAIAAGGGRLRVMFESLLRRIVGERDAALRMHAEQAEALTTLSGEIANELKNPLASVKGLAALMARNLDGSSAERMTVLRREVDRMQSILQNFLNFSRPLVPLNLEATPVDELCRDVVDLHQGVAAERGVGLEVRAKTDVTVLCDPRKVKQILINVVQNALDASPIGGSVSIETAAGEAGGAVVRIGDRGDGLDSQLVERIFDAGVTGKESGSGLGLPVARALARQHGGELTLANGEGGGCVAELSLPADPPVAEPKGAETEAVGGGEQ